MSDPGSSGINSNAVAPLYFNGSPIGDLIATAAANQSVLAGQRQSSENRFWSSRPRMNLDPIRDVFEVDLTATKKINSLSVEIARFPHTAWFQYFDAASSTWMPMRDENTHAPLFVRTMDSIPSYLISLTNSQSKVHPQHYGAGHWQQFDLRFLSIESAKVRIVMLRTAGSPPLNNQNYPVAYSMGVKNFSVGFDASNRALIPRTPFVSQTQHAPFGDGLDILRSPVSYALRENPAVNLLSGGIWKCEPQPVPNAVVNLYLDTRDADGNPQVIDRFYVDPLFSGAKANIYYTLDAPIDPTEDGKDDVIPSGNITADPLVDVDGDGLLIPLQSFLDIDNSAFRFDPSQPFWFGITIAPQFFPGDTNAYVIFDVGIPGMSACNFQWNGSTWEFNYSDSSITSDYFNFEPNSTVSFILFYDGAQIGIISQDGLQNGSGADSLQVVPETIRFGGYVGLSSALNGNYRLLSLTLKVGGASTDYSNYLTDPEDYVVKTPYAYQDDGSTNGSILRYARKYAQFDVGNNITAYGFVGGPISNYDLMNWTPINRDFLLRKGFWDIPPSLCCFINIEFTDLNSEPYDMQTAVVRTVKLFPNPTTPDHIFNTEPSDPVSITKKGGSGATVAQDVAFATGNYTDQAGLVASRNTANGSGYTPTQVLYSEDPVAAEQLRGQGSNLNYARLGSTSALTRWTTSGSHGYRYVDVLHEQKLAYFTGLKSLVMYRVDYTGAVNTARYLETFLDDKNFIAETNNILLSDDGSFFNGIGTWTGVQNVTLAWDDTVGRVDLGSMQMTSTAAGLMSASPQVYAITSGIPYVVNGSVISTGSGSPVYVTIAWFDINFLAVGTITTGLAVPDNPGSWSTISVAADAPLAAAYAQISAAVVAQGAAEVHHFDGFSLGTDISSMTFVPGVGIRNDSEDNVASTQSQTFASRNNVIGFQFTSQQTDPYQLLSDPDFDDPTLSFWRPYQEAVIEFSDDYNSTIGNSVKISRVRSSAYWNNLQATYASWNTIESLGLSWDDMQGGLDSDSVSSGGLTGNETVSPSTIGRVYASARVFTPTNMEWPLFVQLIDDHGNVLAEEARTVSAGEIAEWHCSTTISGDYADRTWDQLQPLVGTWGAGGVSAPWGAQGPTQWGQMETASANRISGVRAQLVQKNPSGDVFYVDSLAIWDDSILWEFSNNGGANWFAAYDIRNNPRGVMIFPTVGNDFCWRVTTGRGGTWIHNASFRPWYNDAAYGIPYTEGVETAGANQSHYDHLPPVLADPLFKAWSDPIPQSWYFIYRQWLMSQQPIVSGDGEIPALPSPTLPEDGFGQGPYGDGPYGS